MTTVKDIETRLFQFAPAELAEEWDNVGLMVGDRYACVEKVLVCLDINQDVIDKAISEDVQLIVTHHPLIFHPVNSLCEQDWAFLLIKQGISVISMHTNLDKTIGGVNDVFTDTLGLENVKTAADGCCRLGVLSTKHTAQALADRVALLLNTTVRVSDISNKDITRVAVCGGSGGDLLLALRDEVDAVISGEIRHHEWLAFNKRGIVAVEAGHHATEVCVVDAVADLLKKEFNSLTILSCKGKEPYVYISKE